MVPSGMRCRPDHNRDMGVSSILGLAEMSFERFLLDIGGLCFGAAAYFDLFDWFLEWMARK